MRAGLNPSPAELCRRVELKKPLRAYAERLKSAADPLTPRKTGALISSGAVGERKNGAEIAYSAPYALRMYGGTAPNGRPYHYRGAPQRGARWPQRAAKKG